MIAEAPNSSRARPNRHQRPAASVRGGPPGVPLPIPPAAPLPSMGSSTGSQTEELALISMAALAIVGFGRGARRECISLLGALVGYVAVEHRWAAVARMLGRLFGAIELDPVGQAASSPAAVTAVPASSGIATQEGGALVWQIAVYVGLLLAAYMLSQRVGRSNIGGIAALVRLPDLVDRLVGAVLGAATGYVTATVLLDRLVPTLDLDLVGARSLAAETLGRAGAPAIFAVVALLILFGVVGLENRGKRVYG